MKFLILFVALLTPCSAQTQSEYQSFIKKSEGYKDRVYKCSTGSLSVGYGTNLTVRGIKVKVGTKFERAQLEKWFSEDVIKAEKAARRVFPSFNKQPDRVKLILVSLVYNVGEGGARKFIKFRKAIDGKDYKSAAAELKDSKWYRQVKGRGAKYVEILNKID